MGIAQALTRRAGVQVTSAARSRLERLAARVAADGGVALEVVLPDGAHVGFGAPARGCWAACSDSLETTAYR